MLLCSNGRVAIGDNASRSVCKNSLMQMTHLSEIKYIYLLIFLVSVGSIILCKATRKYSCRGGVIKIPIVRVVVRYIALVIVRVTAESKFVEA